MKRNIQQLRDKTFDVLVVGGGIYGAAAARDAALRGLSVALVERNDFGCRTSANSLKTVHGGLRYLQQADLKRMRESIRERRTLCKIAPHLVHPLPCVLPTYAHDLAHSRVALSIALRMTDWVGWDRNRGLGPAHCLPRSRMLTARECLALLPGVRREGLTGAAHWYDCQMSNPERLTLAFVLSAVNSGAVAANYVAVEGLLKQAARVTGVIARDRETGARLDIHARVVLNTAGPWVNEIIGFLNGGSPSTRVRLTRAYNLVLRREVVENVAAGIFEPGGQVLFLAPWRGLTLAGTLHSAYSDEPDKVAVSEREIEAFLREINQAYPGAHLERADVLAVHVGLLPGEPKSRDGAEILRHYRIVDHAKADGIEGLVSVIGVKFTTARGVAKSAVDLAARKLGCTAASRSATTPVYGGAIASLDDFIAAARERESALLSAESLEQLIGNHGSEYRALVDRIRSDRKAGHPIGEGSPVIGAEVLHAVEAESARTLSDVVLRRTTLGIGGDPGEATLQSVAALLADPLGWDAARTRKEIDDCRASFSQGPPIAEAVAARAHC